MRIAMENFGVTQEDLDKYRFKFMHNNSLQSHQPSSLQTRAGPTHFNSVTAPSTVLNQNSGFKPSADMDPAFD